MEAIRADLDKNRAPLVNVCMNLTNDFNKASVIRANNAFLGEAVWMVGARKYDPRGAVGTNKYEHVKHTPEWMPLRDELKAAGYTIFAVDNYPERNPAAAYDVILPEKTVFVYGEEQLGLSDEVVDSCDATVYIEQYGSVRSINVAQAAAVLMYEYRRQHRSLNVTN